MPFERFDGRKRDGQRMQLLRKIRLPLFAAVAVLVTFELVARSFITRGLTDGTARTNLGWQSFQPAYIYRIQGSSSSSYNTTADDDLLPQKGDTDYWDDLDKGVDDNDAYEGFDVNEVSDIWDPFIINDRPITEITAKACVWPPSIYDSCMPESSMREDAERGKWIRVEKDINMRLGVYYLYLFYRRLPPGSHADTVRDFRLVSMSEETSSHPSKSEGWQMITQNMRDGVWPSQEVTHLYYRTAPRSDGNKTDEVNEMDVVWGSGGTMLGWERMNRDFAEPREKSKFKDTDEGAELMWRKGTQVAPRAPLPLTFSVDGKFKIMQIADLHFSVSKGKCLDSDWPDCSDPKGSDLVTLDWLRSVLEEEKPNLVVLSGDQLNGQDTSYSSESVILKVAELFRDHKIPWTAVLGNHDSEKTTLTRYGQFVMMQALPYFIGEAGPIEVDGEGNYVLKVYSADESRTQLLSLYFLDSHGYASSWNIFTTEYDYLKDSQIKWFRKQSQLMKKLERPFKPPMLEDSTFGNINNDLEGSTRRTKRSVQRLVPRQASATSLKKPNAMAIFHIPLKEVYDEKPDVGEDAKPLSIGRQDEARGAPKKGDFFQKALLMQTEVGSDTDIDGDSEYAAALQSALPEVKVVLNGHCHISDTCTRFSDVWNCFAGGSSYSGYSERGFDRRVRVYQVSDFGETLSTYKILDTHTDHSGTSESSHQDAGGSSGDGAVQAAEAEAQRAAEEFLKSKEETAGRKVKTRQGSHKIVDEQVLVGKGAPK